jgi:fido (protein-threonine AMPylation protein)
VGATDQATLDAREAAFTATRTYQLEERPESGAFDLAHLQRIHRRLFGDVYDWAGELRTVDITKGDTVFARHAVIAAAGADLFGQFARERHLRGLDAERFSERAGHYLGEINVLHPFREGNGRAQRAFLTQIARESGYRVAWERVTRDDMTHASIAAYHGNASHMAKLIRANLVDLAAVHEGVPALPSLARGVQLATDGTYAGPVVAVAAEMVTQLVAGEPVEHVRARLYGQTGALTPGRTVVITYTAGLGKVVDPRQQTRGRGR